MLRIARHFIQINDRIEVTRSANPCIHCLSIRFGLGTGMVVLPANERQNRCTDRFYSVRMSSHHDLLVRTDHVPDQCLVFGIRHLMIASQGAYVIDSFKDNQVSNAGLRQHIVIEARQSIGPEAIQQQAISTNAVV